MYPYCFGWYIIEASGTCSLRVNAADGVGPLLGQVDRTRRHPAGFTFLVLNVSYPQSRRWSIYAFGDFREPHRWCHSAFDFDANNLPALYPHVNTKISTEKPSSFLGRDVVCPASALSLETARERVSTRALLAF